MKADFAASVELKSENMKTCEHSRHTNLFVGLVLHSPGPISTQLGAPRAVTCDTWRAFTNCRPQALVSHRAQQDMARHYSKLNPNLQRMGLESDGSTCQFKGRIAFWLVGGGMFSEADYGGTIEWCRCPFLLALTEMCT